MKNPQLMERPVRQILFSMLRDTTDDDFLLGKAPVNLEDNWEEDEE
ncbi:MAG: hypothetical protein KGJ09_01400 [Candidatus Omnitrophica bacterium]|nr:hypothetical protein [Candidatus Omnitrophota bacterium]MDE2008716.1 hypothetical protein [Candidatus Omnitrophota bacterium]MDE2214857.1 hypothetical protein [Candidatus Omnitrophota bacterium]MDE2231977.1 hypothetical protein [Candidatus Omnitrophota bacterium]